MTVDDSLPMFASNRPEKGETVANELNKLFGVMRNKLRNTPKIAIATAYLNPAGFNLIADELEKAPPSSTSIRGRTLTRSDPRN